MNAPGPAREYVINGLAATPTVLGRLLEIPEGDSCWDRRAAPDRFSLREMVAHVADWDPIFQERLDRSLTEENPFLPSVDEGVISLERRYFEQDPIENLRRLHESRPTLVERFRSLSDEEWTRPAHREFVGDIDVFLLATMILGHDAYHLRQAVDTLA